MELVYRIEDIRKAAGEFWEKAHTWKVMAFYGEMGAGKTTFIQEICVLLEVSDTVSSPTFSIINEYGYPGGYLYHIDLYRCRDEEEALRAGVEECLYSGHPCLVEWPSRAPGIFPEDTLDIHIKTIDESTRLLSAAI
ncbi:MAG: tRNA (adenosine(37)-N6)-threonylcarbamoyltransferase complex ATPase subunit type 1 TsaE [Flavitalea sp.]